ncbi:CAP domain-containing protein [Haloarcula rubripromontorii]|uniref:CAP domain-containing protein n=1 Tax=Haloarcula rubripromontorii TaxID=1705562 RepID=UPI00345B608A
MEGLPVLRYFTYFPVRLVQDLGLAKAAILSTLVIFIAAVPAGFVPVNSIQTPDAPSISAPNTTEKAESVGMNATQTENLVFDKLNEKRSVRMSKLSYNERVSEVATNRANQMAENENYNHTSVNGETQLERYSFCSGAENIAKTYINTRMKTSNGTRVLTTEQQLSSFLVTQWMNSRPHRERGIYGDSWVSGGAGIAISHETVYAVFAFCSDN